MHDLAVSLVMLIALAVAPWMANSLAVRTVARFGHMTDGEQHDTEVRRVD